MGKNRSMESKRIKYIRMSKARPRSLRFNGGYMNEPAAIVRANVPEEWLPLFDYNKRATIATSEDFFGTVFPSANQESNQRKQALFLSRRKEADTVLYTVMSDGKYLKCVMISDLGQNCFSFDEYHTIPKILRSSITYNNRERAIDHFERGSLRWKESISIPSVE